MSKLIDNDALEQQVQGLIVAWTAGNVSQTEVNQEVAEEVFKMSRTVAPVVEIIGDPLGFVVDGIGHDERVILFENIIEDENPPLLNEAVLRGFRRDLVITSKALCLIIDQEGESPRVWKLNSSRDLNGVCGKVNYERMGRVLSSMVRKATKGHIRRNSKQHRERHEQR